MPTVNSDMQATMDEQHRIQVVQEQRLTQVEKEITRQESRLTVIEVRQTQLEAAMTKQADAISLLATKATLHEAVIEQLKENSAQLKQGNELHAHTMEAMQQRHDDEMKDLTKDQIAAAGRMGTMETRINLIWGVIGTIGGTCALVIAEYLIAHLPK